MKKKFLLAAIVLSITGCGQRYRVNVDSILYINPEGKNYYLAQKENDPRHNEYSAYIERALSYNGYKRVESPDNANIEVSFNYSESKETAITNNEFIRGQDRYVKFNTMTIEIQAANRSHNPAWKTTISCTRKGALLRPSFPIMIGGALKYIGTNQTQHISILTTHDQVSYIKGRMGKEIIIQ